MLINKNNSYLILFVVILLCQITLLYFYMDKKSGFYFEEITANTLSNSPYGRLFPSDECKIVQKYDIWNKWVSGQVFKDYITVTLGNEFNYSNVYENQKQSIQPPLYSFLIHTLSSFNIGNFTKWNGLIFNLLFFVITQLLLFYIGKQIFFSSKYALIVAIFYGFSIACIDNFTIIGSNALLSIFNLLFICVLNKCFDFQLIIYRFIAIWMIVLLGALTNYSFILFSIIILLTYIIINSKSFNYKYYTFFLGSYGLGLISAYLLFPLMLVQLNQILFSNEVIKFDLATMKPGFGWFAYLLRKMLCIPKPLYFYITALFLISVSVVVIIKIIDKYYNNNKKYKMIVVSTFILISLMSFFFNSRNVYQDSVKNLLSFYPIIAIIIVGIFRKIYNRSLRIIFIFFIILSTISPIYGTKSVLLDTNKRYSYVEELIKGNNVFYCFESYNEIQMAVPQLALCRNVYLFSTQGDKDIMSNISYLPSANKTYLLIPCNSNLKVDKYPKILTGSISTFEIDIFEIK